MNDNALIAAVLREVADSLWIFDERAAGRLRDELERRAKELDPPEKNEKPV
jgi:hypothetical protein